MNAQPSTVDRQIETTSGTTPDDVSRLLHDKDSKDFDDLRDRAAYVYVTGSYPTHLRSYMTSLLAKITRYSRNPVSLDRRLGSMAVDETRATQLGLDEHPMVTKVRDFIKAGYRIQLSRDDETTRRPYTKVFLWRRARHGLERITVQRDGSVKDGW
jgi:hypothetical protein